jgi:hypothetical protein
MSVILNFEALLVYRKFHKLCLIALTGIVVLVGSMQGMVHCKTEDGHVGVKFASGVCYGNSNIRVSSEAAAASFEDALSSNKESCGTCVDTPISVHLLRVSKKTNPANPTLQVSPIIISTSIAGCDLSKCKLDTESCTAFSPPLVCLRTIVLLT